MDSFSPTWHLPELLGLDIPNDDFESMDVVNAGTIYSRAAEGYRRLHDTSLPSSPRYYFTHSPAFIPLPSPPPRPLDQDAVLAADARILERQPYSPSRSASYSHVSSTDSDTTAVQHYYEPLPASPGYHPPSYSHHRDYYEPAPASTGQHSPSYSHHGDYIYGPTMYPYAPSPVPSLEAPPRRAHASAENTNFLSPPPRNNRGRSASASSRDSHQESRSSTWHSRSHSHSHSHAVSPPAQVSGFLAPPLPEHRSRSRSRSSSHSGHSSHSHHSGDSHLSASHSGQSSRSKSRSHSPSPSLSYSPNKSLSPSPSSTNLSFMQPTPDQPIILPIGQHGENGYVIVPAAGQDVQVIPVQSTVHYQLTGPPSRIEDTIAITTKLPPQSAKNRVMSFFGIKKK